MSGTLHVVPEGDMVHHDTRTAEADCVCGPRVLPVPLDDGAIGWLLVHHRLRGREKREPSGQCPGRRAETEANPGAT